MRITLKCLLYSIFILTVICSIAYYFGYKASYQGDVFDDNMKLFGPVKHIVVYGQGPMTNGKVDHYYFNNEGSIDSILQIQLHGSVYKTSNYYDKKGRVILKENFDNQELDYYETYKYTLLGRVKDQETIYSSCTDCRYVERYRYSLFGRKTTRRSFENDSLYGIEKTINSIFKNKRISVYSRSDFDLEVAPGVWISDSIVYTWSKSWMKQESFDNYETDGLSYTRNFWFDRQGMLLMDELIYSDGVRRRAMYDEYGELLRESYLDWTTRNSYTRDNYGNWIECRSFNDQYNIEEHLTREIGYRK